MHRCGRVAGVKVAAPVAVNGHVDMNSCQFDLVLVFWGSCGRGGGEA